MHINPHHLDLSKYSIYIIDDNIDVKTLQLLKCIKEKPLVIIDGSQKLAWWIYKSTFHL